MDNWTEWKSYWWDVIATSFNWAVNIWPMPTILFGVVIVAITTGVFWKLGRYDEVKNIAIGFFVSLAVSVVAFVLFVFLVGPFLNSEGTKAKLTELETLRTEKRTLVTTIETLTFERDDANKQQNMFGEARDILQGELDKVRGELIDARKRLDDRKTLMAEKSRRKAIGDQLGKFLEEGEALEIQCLTDVTKPPPELQKKEWLNRAFMFVRNEMSLADATQFSHPSMDLVRQYQIPKEHAVFVNVMEAHNRVLRHLMERLASAS